MMLCCIVEHVYIIMHARVIRYCVIITNYFVLQICVVILLKFVDKNYGYSKILRKSAQVSYLRTCVCVCVRVYIVFIEPLQ